MEDENMLINQAVIQNKCCELIENDINMYFSACMKSAFAYSCLAVKEIKSFDYEHFERLVLSEEEMRIVIQTVVRKLNAELQQEPADQALNNMCTSCVLEDLKNTLDDTVQSYRTTQSVTNFCEKLMNQSVSKACKSLIPIPLANKAIGKLKLGSKLLGELNGKNQMMKQQEELYKQIQGMLINIKLDLINSLEEYVLASINNTGDKKLMAFNAIA